MADLQDNSGLAPLIRLSLPVRDRSTFVLDFSANVSAGGLFFPADEPLSPGTAVRFLIELADGRPMLRGEGVVVWARGTDEYRPTRRRGMGIKFLRIDPRSKEVLEELLECQVRRSAERCSDVPDASSSVLSPDGTPIGGGENSVEQDTPVGDPMAVLETLTPNPVDVAGVISRVSETAVLAAVDIDDELDSLTPEGFDEQLVLESHTTQLPAILPPAMVEDLELGTGLAPDDALPDPEIETELDSGGEPEAKIGLFDGWDEDSSIEELAEIGAAPAEDDPSLAEELAETELDLSSDEDLASALSLVDDQSADVPEVVAEPLDAIRDDDASDIERESEAPDDSAELVADSAPEIELGEGSFTDSGEDTSESAPVDEPAEAVSEISLGEEFLADVAENVPALEPSDGVVEQVPELDLGAELFGDVDEDTSDVDLVEPALVEPAPDAVDQSHLLIDEEETSEIALDPDAPTPVDALDQEEVLYREPDQQEDELLPEPAALPEPDDDVGDIPTSVVSMDDALAQMGDEEPRAAPLDTEEPFAGEDDDDPTPIEPIGELDGGELGSPLDASDVLMSPGAASYVAEVEESQPDTQDIDESDLIDAEESHDGAPVINPDDIPGILEGIFDAPAVPGEGASSPKDATVDMSVWQPGAEMPPMGYSDAPEELSIEIQGVPPDVSMFEVSLPTTDMVEARGDGDFAVISADDIAEEEAISEATGLPDSEPGRAKDLLGVVEQPELDEEYLSLSSEVDDISLELDSGELTSMEISSEEPLAEVISAEDIAEEISMEDIAEESLIPGEMPGFSGEADGTDPRVPQRPSEADQVIDVLLSGGLPLEEPTSSTFVSDAVTTVDQEDETGKSPHPLFSGDSYLMGNDLEEEGSEELSFEDSDAFDSQDGSLEEWLDMEPQRQEEQTVVQGGPPPWSSEIAEKYGVQQTPSQMPPSNEQDLEQKGDEVKETPSDTPASVTQADDSLAMVQPPLGKGQTKKRKSFFRKLFGGGE